MAHLFARSFVWHVAVQSLCTTGTFSYHSSHARRFAPFVTAFFPYFFPILLLSLFVQPIGNPGGAATHNLSSWRIRKKYGKLEKTLNPLWLSFRLKIRCKPYFCLFYFFRALLFENHIFSSSSLTKKVCSRCFLQ